MRQCRQGSGAVAAARPRSRQTGWRSRGSWQACIPHSPACSLFWPVPPPHAPPPPPTHTKHTPPRPPALTRAAWPFPCAPPWRGRASPAPPTAAAPAPRCGPTCGAQWPAHPACRTCGEHDGEDVGLGPLWRTASPTRFTPAGRRRVAIWYGLCDTSTAHHGAVPYARCTRRGPRGWAGKISMPVFGEAGRQVACSPTLPRTSSQLRPRSSGCGACCSSVPA